MEFITKSEKKNFYLWILFFLVLILGSPLLEGGETYHTIIWLRLWVLGFALYYFLSRLQGGRLEIVIPIGSWILILLWLVLSISLFTTHYYYITVYWYSNLLVYLVLFFLSLNLVAEGSRGKRLLLGLFLLMVLAGVMESIFGLWDYGANHPARARGTFFNPAYYSGYLLALISFPLSGLVFDFLPEKQGKKRFLAKAVFCLCLLLVSGGLLVSGSRAIIFGLVPIGWILFLRFRGKALVALVVLLFLLVLIPNPFQHRLKSLKEDPYAWDRLTIWKTSLRMIREHPLGVGLGMYRYYYDRYEYPVRSVKIGRYGKFATWAHNEFLHLAVEASILALLLALVWLFRVLFPLFRLVLGERKDLLKKDLALFSGFSGAVFGILAHSLVESNLHQPPIMLLFVCSLAGIIVLLSEYEPVWVKKSSFLVSRPLFFRGFIFASVVLIALVMSYQAIIFGLTFQGRNISDPARRIKYLFKLARLPSGYAGLYFQIGSDLRRLFQETEEPNLVIQSLPYFEFSARLNSENYDYFYQWAYAIYLLGFFLNNSEMLSRSEEIVKLSLQRNPHYLRSYLLLIQIARLRKDVSGERKWLEMVLKEEPYYLGARKALIEFFLREGEREQARAQLDLLKKQKQEIDQLPRKGMSQLQLELIKITETEIQMLEKELEKRD